LIRRFDKAPKPMAYQPEFLTRVWDQYLSENNLEPNDVDPDSFIRWTYAQALAHRQPRYQMMADRWGLTIDAHDLMADASPANFDALIASALDQKRP